MLNHTNTRNYREPFYLVKFTRKNVDGLNSNREFVHFLFFGSIMQDKDLSLGTSERPAVEALSIKILNTSHVVEIGDLIYRNSKLYQIVSVDKDQFNKQELKLRATYISELEAQADLIEYVTNITKTKPLAKPRDLADKEFVNKSVETLKSELLVKMDEYSTDIEYDALVDSTEKISARVSNIEEDYVKHPELEVYATKTQTDELNNQIQDLKNENVSHNNSLDNLNTSKADKTELNEKITALNQEFTTSLTNYSTLKDLSVLDAKTDELATSLAKSTIDLKELLNQSVESLQNVDKTHETSINSNVEKLKNLTTRTNSLSEQIAQSNRDLQSNKTELNGLIEVNKQDIKKLNASKVKHSKTLETLTESTNALSSKTKELENAINSTNQEVDDLKNSHYTLRNNHLELSKKVAGVESLNNDQTKTIEQLKLSLQANTLADKQTLDRFNALSSEYIQKNAKYSGDIELLKQQAKTFATVESLNNLEASTSQSTQTLTTKLESTNATTLSNNQKVIQLEHRIDDLIIPVIPSDNLTEANLNAKKREMSGLTIVPGNGIANASFFLNKGNQMFEYFNNGNTTGIWDKTNEREVIGLNGDGRIWLHNRVDFANHTAFNVANPTQDSEIANKLYVDNKFNSIDLSNLATKTELGSKLDASKLSTLATKQELSTKAETSQLSTLATKTELNSYATKPQLNSLESTLNSKISTELNSSTALINAQKSQIESLKSQVSSLSSQLNTFKQEFLNKLNAPKYSFYSHSTNSRDSLITGVFKNADRINRIDIHIRDTTAIHFDFQKTWMIRTQYGLHSVSDWFNLDNKEWFNFLFKREGNNVRFHQQKQVHNIDLLFIIELKNE
ncbi:hypothetical protein HLA87_02435 [Mycoplasma miroungigenitalium]|uniref:Uncharacterized protein n=1 Tax=Mycoplasma miroungigenitalium TaxID=754515 RepID=A0A6M4JEX8_9MOLU|nr:hypothetical protein [Mycoplasma miroungigenitalium]QJR43632.1 hypothetical protein HLA87_02435 [Mycoplasma miroungigenitalium]